MAAFTIEATPMGIAVALFSVTTKKEPSSGVEPSHSRLKPKY